MLEDEQRKGVYVHGDYGAFWDIFIMKVDCGVMTAYRFFGLSSLSSPSLNSYGTPPYLTL